MPELRRLGIFADEPPKLGQFYREVFDLELISEDHGQVIYSDGIFNLALLSAPAGAKRGLRYLGFESARVESICKKLENWEDGNIQVTECGTAEIDHELRDPDGNHIGLNRRAFDTAYHKTPVPIRHIALYTPNPQRMADFYCSILDMREVERTDRSSIFVSDGYINVALLYQRKEEPLGLNHFGFHVKSNEEMRIRAERAGVRPGAKRPARIPFAEFRVHDPEGNGVDISEKGFRVDPK
ncbi:MAG: VOC family protein [Deltaproteobacteria bacterium]|nr:VOC family protein [Deltaproteobacteria bacterium]